MIVNIQDKQKRMRFSHDAITLIVNQVIRGEKQKCEEVTICFVTTNQICKLHKKFFDDPSTTDCISFPMDDEEEPYRLLGEIFICPETALHYAQEHNTDPFEEVTLYIIHGLLHLMGYDDINDEDIVQMRKAEKRHMNKIKKLNYQLKQ